MSFKHSLTKSLGTSTLTGGFNAGGCGLSYSISINLILNSRSTSPVNLIITLPSSLDKVNVSLPFALFKIFMNSSVSIVILSGTVHSNSSNTVGFKSRPQNTMCDLSIAVTRNPSLSITHTTSSTILLIASKEFLKSFTSLKTNLNILLFPPNFLIFIAAATGIFPSINNLIKIFTYYKNGPFTRSILT